MTEQTSKQSEKYHLDEISQAWIHYRHLEETRTKYLAFFATVILGSAGFIATLIKDATSPTVLKLVYLLSPSFFILHVFSFVIWANTVRMGSVLAQYEAIMSASRRAAHGTNHPFTLLWDVRSRLPSELKSGVFSVQSGGEAITWYTCVLMCLAQIALLITLATLKPVASEFATLLTGSFAALMFSTMLWGATARQRIRTFFRSDKGKVKLELPRLTHGSDSGTESPNRVDA